MAKLNKDLLVVAALLVIGVILLLVGLLVNFGPEAGRMTVTEDSLSRWAFIGLGGLTLIAGVVVLLLALRRRRQVADPSNAAEQGLVDGMFSAPKPLKPGIYHLRSGEAFSGYRVHLRLEPGGLGTLVVNASKIIHLNQTAAEYAKLIVEECDPRRALDEIVARYRVSRKTAAADYDRIREIITELSKASDVCPVTYLNLDRDEPFSVETFAPYRMDLVLTYACNNECPHCYVDPARRGKVSLEFEDWCRVMDKLWAAGIPHVTFTGGEATLYPRLRELIEYAEDLGLVTGLLTNGRRLADMEYLKGLVEVGLDHVQITLESHDEKVHDAMVGHPGAWKETVQGVRNALELPVYTLTNTTLTRANAPEIERTVQFLAELGLPQIAANGMIHSGGGVGNPQSLTEAELAPYVETLFEAAVHHGVNFLWYTPTRYEDLDPTEIGVGIKTCSAARFNLAVEPDGEVLPCQSYFESLGNILTDDWESIWSAPLALRLRRREWVPEECPSCTNFPLCGGGCPLLYQEAGVVSCAGTA